MSLPSASIIAATYNQPRELDLSLHSLRRQSTQDFEIVLADDGSGPETREVIERHQREFFGDRLSHHWQEDQGFRKSKILNVCISKARAPWLIFLDCDTFVHRDYVRDHLSVQAPRSVFMGRRIDLSPSVTQWIREDIQRAFSPAFRARLVRDALLGRQRNLNRAFRVGSAPVAHLLGMDRVPDLLGSNFSTSKELLLEINGFDESLVHYWGEDGDLYVRLRNTGARMHGRKSFAVQYHLYHRMRDPQPGALEWYREHLKRTDYVWCPNGIVR